MRHILIVIPTYDEADNIEPLVQAICRVFAGHKRYRPDILFVDDNSPDGTADRIRRLKVPLRTYVLSGARAGLGKAYARGLPYGMDLRPYFAVVMMDADLSHDPADIPRLLQPLEAGADFVIGSRYISGGRIANDYPIGRQLQSRIANWIAATLLDTRTPVKDLTAGFKAIRATTLQRVRLSSIQATGYVFQVCLLYACLRGGAKVTEVPITFQDRTRGVSKIGWRDIAEFLVATYRLNPAARLQRAVRFAAVGASGTVVNLAVLVGLVHAFGVKPHLAYAVALEVSIISNFVLNHLFTFNNFRTASLWRGFGGKLVGYNLVALIGAGIAWLAFLASTEVLGLHYVLADLLGIALAMGWNYWLSTTLVWPLVDTEDPWAKSRELQQV